MKSIMTNPLKRSKRSKKNQGVKSFAVRRAAEGAVERRNLGLKPVPVDKIVGSVGRYRDFDSRFRLKDDPEPFRLQRIKEAMTTGKSLPPVDLYKIKDEYYVVDGNHRVSAAKEFGREMIDARIIEYIPSQKTLENILYREKADFEKTTGLPDKISLTEVGQYAQLMAQIEAHREDLASVAGDSVSLQSAAQDWYKTIYRPLAEMIKRSGLTEAFGKRTLADIYTYITVHRWQKGRKKRKYGIGLEQFLPGSMQEFRAKMMATKTCEFPEMEQRVTAFLMISVGAGREDRVMERIFAYKEVAEVHFVPGDFDIIAKIEVKRNMLSSDSEVIGQFVQNRIRRIQGITKTHTIIPLSSKRKQASNTP